MKTVMLGQYAIAPVLTVFLALFYRFFPVDFSDKYKALIAVCFGIALSLLSVLYQGLAYTAPVIIDYGLHGLMLGASAVGIYELQRTVTKPRE